MVSDKAVLVILIIAIVLSVLSTILTASFYIRTPIQAVGEPIIEDSASGEVMLMVIPRPSPSPATGGAG